jgi:hypothetical protein
LLLFVNNVYSPGRLQTIIMFCSLHKWHSRKHLVEQCFITNAASVLMELMHCKKREVGGHWQHQPGARVTLLLVANHCPMSSSTMISWPIQPNPTAVQALFYDNFSVVERGVPLFCW